MPNAPIQQDPKYQYILARIRTNLSLSVEERIRRAEQSRYMAQRIEFAINQIRIEQGGLPATDRNRINHRKNRHSLFQLRAIKQVREELGE